MKRSKWNKKWLFVLIPVCVLILTGAGATYAYMKSVTAEKVNTFTVGNVTTDLKEEIGETGADTIGKSPYVVNTGENTCYIRMRVTVSPEDSAELTGVNAKDWKLEADGFYYYQKPVEKGGQTTPVFTGVKVSEGFTGDLEVTCYQEAVQSEAVAEGRPVTDMMEIWKAYDTGAEVFAR